MFLPGFKPRSVGPLTTFRAPAMFVPGRTWRSTHPEGRCPAKPYELTCARPARPQQALRRFCCPINPDSKESWKIGFELVLSWSGYSFKLVKCLAHPNQIVGKPRTCNLNCGFALMFALWQIYFNLCVGRFAQDQFSNIS